LPNTSKMVKNTPLRVAFSTLFAVFEYVLKHGLSCLIYYFKRYWMFDGFWIEICSVLNANEIQIAYDKHHKVSSLVKSDQNTHNSVKYEVI